MSGATSKEWKSQGVACLIRRRADDVGWRCGYARVPKGHPWYGQYATLQEHVACHGGLTFAGPLQERGDWWLGFDCRHVGDDPSAWTEGAVAAEVEKLVTAILRASLPPGRYGAPGAGIPPPEAGWAEKGRKVIISYPCAACGYVAEAHLLEAIDSGMVLLCNHCDGKTIVQLRRAEELSEDVRWRLVLDKERDEARAAIEAMRRERDEARALAGRARVALDICGRLTGVHGELGTCPCPVCCNVRTIPEEWERRAYTPRAQ